MKLLVVFALCFIAVFAKDEPQCKHPSGGGLPPALKECVDLLPIDEMLSIYLAAVSNDKEVESIVEYIASKEFHEVVKAIHSSPEYTRLLAKACDTLYFDALYYLDIVGDMFEWPKTPSSRFGRSSRAAGVRGLIDDIVAILPLDKLLAFYNDKMANDTFVQSAMELLKSEDFVNLVRTITKLPQYTFMEDELRKMNVNVDGAKAFFKEHFGWD